MRVFFIWAFWFLSSIAYSQTVKVMTYNIRLDTEADGLNQWKNRIGAVTNLIQKYNPDLLGVQEALPNQMADLSKNLPGYQYVGVGRDDGKEKGEFSAIFYKQDRFEVTFQKTKWLSETPDIAGSKSWDAAITRIVTYAHMKDKASGKEFVYFNTHFDHIGKEARLNSALLIKRFIAEETRGHHTPALVSGDFNSEPPDPPYQNMIQPGEVRLIDSRPHDSTTGTFCGFEVNKMACRTLDYIFHSPDWKTLDYRIIQDHNGTYYPSDHLPVMATFSMIR